MGNKFSAFVVGGLVGAGVALLCAPRKGVETRALVAEKASTVFGQAKTVGDQAVERGQALYEDAVVQGQKAYDYAVAGTQAAYTDVTQKGRQVYETAAHHVQGAAQKAQKTADAVKPAFSDKNDELRAKIDAARERIAAQVAKNAEAAHAVVVEMVPVAAQKVNEVVDAAQEKVASAAAVLAGSAAARSSSDAQAASLVEQAPVSEAPSVVYEAEPVQPAASAPEAQSEVNKEQQ